MVCQLDPYFSYSFKLNTKATVINKHKADQLKSEGIDITDSSLTSYTSLQIQQLPVHIMKYSISLTIAIHHATGLMNSQLEQTPSNPILKRHQKLQLMKINKIIPPFNKNPIKQQFKLKHIQIFQISSHSM